MKTPSAAVDDCKKAAALAIRLIEDTRKRSFRSALLDTFWGRDRARVRALANEVLGSDDLPIEPYLITIVLTAAGHFGGAEDAPLPTEQEIIDWIGNEGGIPVLLLRSLNVIVP